MESNDPKQLRCPECLAESPASSDRCIKCGAALFPTGFDLGRFRARAPLPGDDAAVPAAPIQAPAEIAAPDLDPEPEGVHGPEDTPPRSDWEIPRLYDEETEVLTSEAFRLFGATLVDEARAQHQPLSLLLVALSGAEAGGDAAPAEAKAQVRALADVLRRSQRGSDLVGRHGARGFALLLSGMSLAQAGNTARWVEMVMRQSPLGAEGRGPALAQGIAELLSGSDLTALIHSAEELLAQAMQDGGSRIRSSAAPQPAVPAPLELIVPEPRLSPAPAQVAMPEVRPARRRRRRPARTAREVAPARAARSRPQHTAQSVRADVIAQEDGTAYAVSLRVDMALDGPRADVEIRRR